MPTVCLRIQRQVLTTVDLRGSASNRHSLANRGTWSFGWQPPAAFDRFGAHEEIVMDHRFAKWEEVYASKTFLVEWTVKIIAHSTDRLHKLDDLTIGQTFYHSR